MFLAIGIKKAFKIIWQYPTLILAPVFSIWTLGPVLISIGKRKCLKISLLLTWGNFFITSGGILFFVFFYYFKKIGILHYYPHMLPIIACSTLFLTFVSLFILVTLPKLKNSCCTCCQNKCFPIFQETCLDPESPFELILWPQHEMEVDPKVELRNDVKKRFLEATISRF